MFSSSPKIISQGDHELHEFWIEENEEMLESKKMPTSTPLLKYVSTIKSKIPDTNPYSLLKKEYNDFMNTGVPELIAEAPNMGLVLSKKAGTLH